MSKVSFIAKIGQNPNFVAFMAHAGFAYFVVSLFPGISQYVVAAVCAVAFGIKEMWFDIKFEENPPQTFIDSLEDFSGYLFGIVIALTVAHYGL